MRLEKKNKLSLIIKERKMSSSSSKKLSCANSTISQDRNVKRRPKTHYLLLISLLAISILFYYLAFANRCNLPIEFSVGTIDSRFGISKEDATLYAEGSAKKWNDALGKTVLIYKENADLKINFVYDYRQENLDELKSEMSNLDISDASINEAKKAVSDKISEFEADLSSYNSEVAYWNSVGGAPTATYNKLQTTRTELEERREELTNAIKLLDSEIDSYNKDLSELQEEVNSKKDTTEVQGIYKGKDNLIDIYTFGDIDELKVVLMHELGHAIGADHANQPKSIMYYLIEDQDYSSASLTNEDIRLVKDACKI